MFSSYLSRLKCLFSQFPIDAILTLRNWDNVNLFSKLIGLISAASYNPRERLVITNSLSVNDIDLCYSNTEYGRISNEQDVMHVFI